jgi:hypothetical protein
VGNVGIVTLTVHGTNLDPAATVKLSNNGSEISGFDVSGEPSRTTLIASFDVSG